MSVNGQVGIVLELKLLLLLACDRDLLILVLVHLSRSQLLRLQAFLISTTARRLATLALSNGFVLCFFKLAAIYVL